MSGIQRLRKASRILLAGDSRWCRALAAGVAAGVEHVPPLRQLRLKTVVDVGANRGQFALAIRHMFPEARIIAFEPLAAAANTFRHVVGGQPGVVFHQLAIGPSSGRAKMHVSKEADSSSLLGITQAQSELFPGTHEIGTTMVDVVPLDACLTPEEIVAPSLLKLDVQGFELQALEGSQKLLAAFSWIYAECSFIELYERQHLAGDVVAWLRERQFVLRGVHNIQCDGRDRAIQGDFLFGRQSSLPQSRVGH
jgi:FkbM family methyltransferase